MRVLSHDHASRETIQHNFLYGGFQSLYNCIAWDTIYFLAFRLMYSLIFNHTSEVYFQNYFGFVPKLSAHSYWFSQVHNLNHFCHNTILEPPTIFYSLRQV